MFLLNSRIGEIRTMKSGLTAKIIEYRKAIDIDVEFENGAVVTGKSYQCFRNGSIRCPMQYEFFDGFVKCINPNISYSFIVDYDVYIKIKDKYICRNNFGYPQCVDYKLHRYILGFPDASIDHINGDVTDNRKANLRVCNDHQNQCNRGKTVKNTSGYKGVSWYAKGGYWVAKIRNHRKQFHLGCFETREAAAIAYNNAAKSLFGEFARLNEVPA